MCGSSGIGLTLIAEFVIANDCGAALGGRSELAPAAVLKIASLL